MADESQSCQDFLSFVFWTSFTFIFISAGLVSVMYGILLLVHTKRIALGWIWIAISIIVIIACCCCVKKYSNCRCQQETSITQGTNTVEPLPQQQNTSIDYPPQLENQVIKQVKNMEDLQQ